VPFAFYARSRIRTSEWDRPRRAMRHAEARPAGGEADCVRILVPDSRTDANKLPTPRKTAGGPAPAGRMRVPPHPNCVNTTPTITNTVPTPNCGVIGCAKNTHANTAVKIG